MDAKVLGYDELFQSTLPVWGGTKIGDIPNDVRRISIHPPRVGRDECDRQPVPAETGISIHPPRVGRDEDFEVVVSLDAVFQSTLPVWGGTPL